MSETVVVRTEHGKNPRYYLGMLNGSPCFGAKRKAVRISDDMAETIARQLRDGWKVECWPMNGLIRFGSKNKEAA